MRTLWVSPVPPAPFGPGTRTFYFLRRLAETSEIDLIAGSGDISLSDDARAILDAACRSVTFVPQPQLSPRHKRLIQLRSLLSRRPAQYGLFYSPQVQKCIDRLVRENSYDLVVMESSFLGYYNFGSDMLKVVDQHNVESDVLLRSGQNERSRIRRAYNRLEYWKFRSQEEHVCRDADLILAASSRDRDVMRAWGDIARCVVVPNGVDTTFFTLAPVERRAANVVFTGTMSYSPNVDAMLYFTENVWPRIRAGVPDAHLQIVGQNPAPEIVRLAELEGITVTGPVPDVRPFLAEGAVVVVPLRMGGGTRVKILEAMAMGRPVVSTTVGSEGLDAQDGRHLLIADDPVDFADSVIELLQDRARGDALGQEGRRLVEEIYDWSSIGVSVERAVRALLQDVAVAAQGKTLSSTSAPATSR